MDRKKKGPPPDEQIFRQAMAGVEPLKSPARTDSAAPKPAAAKRSHASNLSTSAQACRPLADDQWNIDADDGSSHRKNGVQKKIMQKLKRGRFQLGDQLDLHHMNTAMGSRVLLEFIADSQSRSLQCIRIIHGKGLRSGQEPRLKIMTRQLLRDHPQVLAFTACKPADGGEGATDVLLKT